MLFFQQIFRLSSVYLCVFTSSDVMSSFNRLSLILFFYSFLFLNYCSSLSFALITFIPCTCNDSYRLFVFTFNAAASRMTFYSVVSSSWLFCEALCKLCCMNKVYIIYNGGLHVISRNNLSFKATHQCLYNNKVPQLPFARRWVCFSLQRRRTESSWWT